MEDTDGMVMASTTEVLCPGFEELGGLLTGTLIF